MTFDELYLKRLNETNLSRMWQRANDTEHGWVIVSSEKTGAGKDERAAKAIALRDRIRSLGLGYVAVNGHWAGSPELTPVNERAFFACGEAGEKTARKLDDLTRFAFTELKQDAVLRNRSGNIVLIWADGRIEDKGKFSPDKVGQCYPSLVKGAHAGRTFVFDGTEAQSMGEAMIRQSIASRMTAPLI